MKTPERKSLLEMEAADTCAAQPPRHSVTPATRLPRAHRATPCTRLQVATARRLGRSDAARGTRGPVKPVQRDSASSPAQRQARAWVCAGARAHASTPRVARAKQAATSSWLPLSKPHCAPGSDCNERGPCDGAAELHEAARLTLNDFRRGRARIGRADVALSRNSRISGCARWQ